MLARRAAAPQRAGIPGESQRGDYRLCGERGLAQKDNPTKLHGEDIAHIVKAMLEMDDRGFTPELSVFATNPKD